MKHIKHRKIFESFIPTPEDKNEVIQIIKDICLEAEDNGFKVSVSKVFKGIFRLITIVKVTNQRFPSRGDKKFKYSDVEDVVNRIFSYLGSEKEGDKISCMHVLMAYDMATLGSYYTYDIFNHVLSDNDLVSYPKKGTGLFREEYIYNVKIEFAL